MTYLTAALRALIPAVRALQTDVHDAPDVIAAAAHRLERQAEQLDDLTSALARLTGLNRNDVIARYSRFLSPDGEAPTPLAVRIAPRSDAEGR